MCLPVNDHLDQGPSALPEAFQFFTLTVTDRLRAAQKTFLRDRIAQSLEGSLLISMQHISEVLTYNCNDPNPVFSHGKPLWTPHINPRPGFIVYMNTTLRSHSTLLNDYLVLDVRLSEDQSRMTTFLFFFWMDTLPSVIFPQNISLWFFLKGRKSVFLN